MIYWCSPRFTKNTASFTPPPPTTHFGPDIKNTITIFHHLWQGFESADKPWLRYYFHSDKQSNIFYSSGFHLIAVSRHAAFHSSGSRKSLQTFKQAFSVIKSLISTPAFNPSANTLYISNSLFDPLFNVKVKSWCYFLINLLFFLSWTSLFTMQSVNIAIDTTKKEKKEEEEEAPLIYVTLRNYGWCGIL